MFSSAFLLQVEEAEGRRSISSVHTISGGDFATDESLKNLGIFAYPDLKNLKKTTVQNAQTFQFIMTDSAGKKRFGTCARCLAFGVAPRFPVSVVLMTDCAPEPSFLEQLLSLVTQKVMFGSLLSCVPILHAAYQAEMAPRKFPTQETQDVCVRVSASEEYRFIRPPERDCLLEQMGVVPVLHKLSATNLVTLFAHLLHERRVVFQSASLESLSRGIQSITALLYPFSWQWVYVPVLPETLISFACAPMPFVIGILSSFPLLDLKDLMDEVYIFDLDRDQFVMRGSHNDLESLPAGYRNAIIKQLEISKQEDRAGSAWQGKLLARPFLAFFVQLFWNYKRFFTSGPMREFDRAGFLESKSSTVSRAFLQEFLGTQMATTFFHEYERGNTVHFATFERLTGFVLDEFNNAVAELERANPRIKFRRRMSRMLPFLNKPGSMASLPALGASHNNLSAINTANAASGTGTAVGATAAAAGATSPSAARKGLTSPGLNRRKMQASSATAADENNAFDVQIVKKEEQSVFPGIKLSTMSRRPKQTVSKPSVNDVFTTPVKVAAAPVSDAFASPQSPFHIVGPVDPSQSPCLFSPQSMVVVAPTSIATGPSVTFRDEDEQMASPPPFHPASPTDSNRIQHSERYLSQYLETALSYELEGFRGCAPSEDSYATAILFPDETGRGYKYDEDDDELKSGDAALVEDMMELAKLVQESWRYMGKEEDEETPVEPLVYSPASPYHTAASDDAFPTAVVARQANSPNDTIMGEITMTSPILYRIL